jgi:hypothetical protein
MYNVGRFRCADSDTLVKRSSIRDACSRNYKKYSKAYSDELLLALKKPPPVPVATVVSKVPAPIGVKGVKNKKSSNSEDDDEDEEENVIDDDDDDDDVVDEGKSSKKKLVNIDSVDAAGGEKEGGADDSISGSCLHLYVAYAWKNTAVILDDMTKNFIEMDKLIQSLGGLLQSLGYEPAANCDAETDVITLMEKNLQRQKQ